VRLDSPNPPDDTLPAQFVAKLAENMGSMTEPRLLVLYPGIVDLESMVWSVPLTAEHVDALLDSPARQEIAKRILAGQSAVWVLVESGDPERDAQVTTLFAEQLARLNSEVKLPSQELIEAEKEFRADNPIELQVEFSLIRVSRDDPREQAFVSMLLNSESDLLEFDEPIALPVFGRGRTYYALVGDGITPKNIENSCRFVCGACSCQVKQQNPGVDLLMAVDWASQVIGSAMKEPELPQLTGIGFVDAGLIDASSTSNSAEEVDKQPNDIPSSPVAAASAARTELDEPNRAMESTRDFERSLAARLAAGLLAGAAIIGVLSLWFFRSWT
jgi:hypothetical protein